MDAVRSVRLKKTAPRVVQWIDVFAERYSKSAFAGYRSNWNQWMSFLQQRGIAWDKATDETALLFLRFLRARPGLRALTGENEDDKLSHGTLSNKLHNLKMFYEYAVDNDYCIKNPFKKIAALEHVGAPEKRPTQALTFDELRRLFASVNKKTITGLRDFCLLGLLFFAGLRRAEVVNLRMGDVGRTNKGTVFVTLRRTKAAEVQEQALPADIGAGLTEWVKQRNIQGAHDNDALIANYWYAGWQPFRASSLANHYYKLLREAGVRRITVHGARATFITTLYEMGANEKAIQDAARHKDARTTAMYRKRATSLDDSAAHLLSAVFEPKKT